MLHWHDHLIRATPYRPWLQVKGSLTHALMARCQAFNVVRLSQRSAPAHLDEERLMGLPHGRQATIREVLLRCGENPLVFAHSVIPRAGLRGPWIGLSGLGNRPLGAALFSDPVIQRHPLEFTDLDRRHPLYRKAAAHLDAAPATLWARRCRFTRDGHSILVTEVFLPVVLELP
ncbi:MAG: chorismate lyase [Pseudomonadota bacterium]